MSGSGGWGGTVTEIAHLFLPLGSICVALHRQVAPLPDEYFQDTLLGAVSETLALGSAFKGGPPELHYQHQYFNEILKKSR